MRYVPSTKIGSLVVASIREAARTTKADPDLARSVHAAALTSVEAHEANISRSKQFEELNDEMSAKFLQWATAWLHGDGHLADRLEDELDALAKAHPFDYAESKRIFYAHFHKSSYHYAKTHNYRASPDAKSKFGLVDAKVSGSGKVAVIGDWGTGEPDADGLMAAVKQHAPDVILHLGDIYEAGLPIEIEEHFLEPITRTYGTARPPILTIPGNHEYFSGGTGFFELIDVLNGGPKSEWNQEASFFCLQSDDRKYQFLGADSGLGCIDHRSSPNLEQSEIDWHREQIATFPGKTIFMTHHQLIAVDHEINGYARHSSDGYGYWNRHFVDAFSDTIPGTSETYMDRIHLWLWGHAHWFIPFKGNLPIPGGRGTLKRGQLLGGSAREKTYRRPTTCDGTSPGDYCDPHPGVTDQVAPWVMPRTAVDPSAPSDELLVPHATNDKDSYSGQKLYNHTFAIMDLSAGEISYYEVPSWTSDTPNPKTTQLPKPLLTLPI